MTVTLVSATAGSLTLTYCRTGGASDAAAWAARAEAERASGATTANDVITRIPWLLIR